MNSIKTNQLLRAIEDLRDSLGFLGGAGPEGEASLADEAVLLNRGSDAEVVAFWKAQDSKWFYDEAGDFVRRQIVLQQNRHSLYEALSELAWPIWSMDDVFTVPSGPSALRAQLLVKPPEDLVPTGELDYCEEKDGEPHRLLLAVALGDPLSVAAVERTPWVMGATSASEEAKARGEGALMWLQKCPADKDAWDFGRDQWRKAQQEGLWEISEAKLSPQHAHLAKHLRVHGNSSFQMLSDIAARIGTSDIRHAEVFRELAWSIPVDLATALWSEKYAWRFSALRGLPAASGAPFLSTPGHGSDPFLRILRNGILVEGRPMFAQWENPSFDAERLDQQVPAWRMAIADIVMKAAPEGQWNISTQGVLGDVQRWLVSSDAWPLDHLSEKVARGLTQWSTQCAEAVAALSVIQNATELKGALMDIKLLANGLTSAPMIKPRF